MTETIDVAPVAMTQAAARQVNKVLSSETPGACLRVAVNGGGCSGFQYAFEIVHDREPDDLVVERDGPGLRVAEGERVLHPVLVVALGKVLARMCAARFLTGQRGVHRHHRLRD